MTGFRGQKFDFVGEDEEWYCVLQDGAELQLNMRVTSPVPSVPEITYITGISVRTIDLDGLSHTIVVQVTDPHDLSASCREEVSPCLADGALSVEVDGREVLLSPGTVSVGPGTAISAVNLPGACRSFGFEKYWESKKLEYAQAGRKLEVDGEMQDMAEWILGDPTATNIAECVEYVARAKAGGGSGLFAHESEHTSFQIMTPSGAIRLSHGRLHQLPMRDPTDQFDMPDHLTWQMNLAIDHKNVSPSAQGILGETLRPTIDGDGNEVTEGMAVIRGSQEDYRVEGPFGITFALSEYQE
ncbi:unnamed protein product [Scytosiphon promiscuus]